MTTWSRLFARRRRVLALVAFALVSAFTIRAVPDLAPKPVAAAPADDEAAFVAALNQVRAGVGLPPLQVDPELTALARQWAQTMADAGHIFHASSLSAGVTTPWLKLGENVGVGANVEVLVDAFVASPGHYANIVDPAYTRIGVGVVYAGSALYTAHRFMQPAGAPPPTTTAPPTTAPSTTTAPPPTTTPAPAPT
ncbi:MAG: CAP domain-containing protein, partial [Actinomyces sp.]